MPDFDGGHYFLTALSPVLAGTCERADGSTTSHAAALREVLATLPTAVQSQASVDADRASPFARCTRTHFARLAVIDQPAFNGRDPGNSLMQGIRKTDLLVPQPVDCLTRAWLLLAIDFDAGEGEDHGLHDYLAGLWRLMPDEFAAIYRHCHGYEGATDGDGFARYIRRCHVETTMPFNDYWTSPPTLPRLPLAAIGAGIAAVTLAAGLIVGRIAGTGWGIVAALVALGAALYAAYRHAGGFGARPFPAAPGSDLRTILKALHLQQRFVPFAAANQGASPATLHAAFGAFLAATSPADTHAPTQAPGVIRS